MISSKILDTFPRGRDSGFTAPSTQGVSVSSLDESHPCRGAATAQRLVSGQALCPHHTQEALHLVSLFFSTFLFDVLILQTRKQRTREGLRLGITGPCSLLVG